MKKLISCLLAVMMLCTAVSAFAEALVEKSTALTKFLDETDLQTKDLALQVQSGDKVSDLVIRLDGDNLHLVSRNDNVEDGHIQLNPTGRNVNQLNIAPRFVESLDHAEGWHLAPAGKITSSWVRENGQIRLTLEIPHGMTGRILLESGFRFTDGYSTKPLASGTYWIEKI